MKKIAYYQTTFLLTLVLVMVGCAPAIATATPSPMSTAVGYTSAISTPTPSPTATASIDARDLSEDEIATLNSLEKLDDYPLYILHYVGKYPDIPLSNISPDVVKTVRHAVPIGDFHVDWGCSLFAALSDPESRLYGRNFDWRFSPALLLFTAPPDAYASVSMVDMEYLGIDSSQVLDLTTLSLVDRQNLLYAPALPFDGMNEKGLAIGMAAVPSGNMHPDPNKKTIDNLGVMREILDHASTVDEAIDILASYNIRMDEVPIHYLIASADGDSALVEFYQGEMVVMRNEDPWQMATNFLVASTGGSPQGHCARYDHISQQLQEVNGQLTVEKALNLLSDVSQDSANGQSGTQWSVVYDMSAGSIHIVMGRKYGEEVHTLYLETGSQ
jgi:hypothetical protein